MNLPLHLGLLGVIEAGLIAFVVGLLAYVLWRWLARSNGWSDAKAIGWASLSATVVAAGIDAWNMLYLSIARLESPLYARLALQDVHDPEALGGRVVCEAIGAWAGVVAAWLLFNRHSSDEHAPDREKNG